MDILYRRFVLFTAFVAVLGVFAANIIIETKRPHASFSNSTNIQANCKNLKVCAISESRSNLVYAAISQG